MKKIRIVCNIEIIENGDPIESWRYDAEACMECGYEAEERRADLIYFYEAAAAPNLTKEQKDKVMLSMMGIEDDTEVLDAL